MLQDIINGQEKSKFILVTDEYHSCGRDLLNNLILDLLQRLKFVQTPPPPIGEGYNVFDGIDKMLGKLGHLQSQSVAVVVDSLTIPLILLEAPSVCQSIHRLSGVQSASTVSQVVALFHRDVHGENEHRLLTHQANSVLRLGPGPQGTLGCHVRHCRPTGKVLKSVESFRVDSDFLIQDIQPVKADMVKLQPIEQSNQADPISDLTFNLSLTSSEEEARSQVVLPYLIDRSTPEESVSQGRIHYQADDADDLDEEDPDDDLNI